MTAEARIVGIDPGTTAGVAVLDLDGDLVHAESGRHMGKDGIIRAIVDHGSAVIVATDVAPAPSQVTGIAANLGARLIVPDSDLSQGRKDDLIAGHDTSGLDSHGRDALAAAVFAYREVRDTIDRLRGQVDAAGHRVDVDDAAAAVLAEGDTVSQAVAAQQPVADSGDEAPSTAQEGTDWEAVAADRQDRIERLEQQVDRLQDYVDELREEDDEDGGVPEAELRRRNREIRRLREEADRRDAAVERLEAENARLREAVQRLAAGDRFVPREDPAGSGADAVLVERYDGGPVAEAVDVVLAEEATSEGPAHVSVVAASDVDATVLEDGAVVDPDVLAAAVADAEDGEGSFMAWLEEYRERGHGG